MTPSPSLAPQSIFAGQFRIVAQIARGGMGTIYHVEQLPTGHPRALKVILPEYAQDPRVRARFEQEARIAAHIQSEHAAQVIAAGVDAETNTPWLAMELLQGRDLAAVLQERGRLPPGEVAVVLQQLGHALAAAHRIGVVHRDLKPENIFIAASRRSDVAFTVKVLDFGVAKWAQDSRPGRATAVVGSPLWMAPEQLDARGILGPHTDIWALGLLAFATLTGRPYWRGAGATTFSLPEVVGEIMAAPIVPASQRAAELGAGGLLPPGFDGWFARCVERDGALRFGSVEACVTALLPLLGAPAVPSAVTAGTPAAGAPSVPATMAIPAMPTPQHGSFQPLPAEPALDSTTAWSPGARSSPAGSSPPTGPGLASTAAWSPGAGSPYGPAPGGPFGGPTQSAPPGGYGGQFPPPIYGAAPGYGGASGPWSPPAATARAGGSGKGLMIALVLGAFLFLCAGGSAAYFALTPNCDPGHHRSNGRCCPDGSSWNRSQRACVSTLAAPLPTMPAPYPAPMPAPSPEPGLTPIAPPPAPAPAPAPAPRPSFVHACDGVWGGAILENTGARGTMDVLVRTAGPTCARWTERWESGARCVYTVSRCTLSANGLRGTGRSVSPNCTPTVSMGLTCSPTGAAFREQVGNVIDTAALARR